MEIEQVVMTKLLGVMLDCKLLWSKHVDTTVAKMWRSLSIIKRWTNVQSCGQVPQRGTLENYNCLKTGQHGWPLNVHRELTLMTCM